MSDGGMWNKPVFHEIDAKVYLSFYKQGNKNHQAIGVPLKNDHMIDRQKIAAKFFRCVLGKLFLSIGIFLPAKKKQYAQRNPGGAK